MKEPFEFSKYTDYDLFHIRYGRGAVIVAIKKGSEKSKIIDGTYPPIHVAKIFNSRDQKLNSPSPHFDPIKEIEECDGFVRVVIDFERKHENKPTYKPLKSIVERILPYNQVTFEVVK
jgi:hypothetical protein